MLHEMKLGMPTVREAVSAFVDMTDLRVLRQIDETVDALLQEARFFLAHSQMGRMILANIKGQDARCALVDPDGALTEVLGRLVEVSGAEVKALQRKKAVIDGDRRLKGHHCDQLHSAYEDAIAACAEDAEVAEAIMDALVAHDLRVEPRDGPVYGTVAELHDALVDG